MIARSAWFPQTRPRSDAPVRVVALPYAGVGASAYHGWDRALAPANVDFIAVQLPGRENRLAEPAFTSLRPLASAVIEAIDPLLDRPVALFGHSMGALLAFEMARLLSAGRRTSVMRHLLVSAAVPPQVPRSAANLHDLPEERFLEEVGRRYGALPGIVFESAELRGIVVPPLRGDLTAVETYDTPRRPPSNAGSRRWSPR